LVWDEDSEGVGFIVDADTAICPVCLECTECGGHLL
jgi:hypothetical protein